MQMERSFIDTQLMFAFRLCRGISQSKKHFQGFVRIVAQRGRVMKISNLTEKKKMTQLDFFSAI